MIDYELAKQLKDAGFPQDTDDMHRCIAPDGNILGINHSGDDARASCYFPTLSELIEACRERFISLHNLGLGNWEAEAFKNLIPTGRLHEIGSTPEEAVAHLWLKLNK